MRSHYSACMAAALLIASAGAAQAQPPNAAESMTGKQSSRIVGMKVQSPSGDDIGAVKEVVADDAGRTRYAIVSYGAAQGPRAKYTAVPWAVITPMIQGDKVVMDEMELEEAPVLANATKLNPSSGTWSRNADSYWRAVASRSIPSEPDR